MFRRCYRFKDYTWWWNSGSGPVAGFVHVFRRAEKDMKIRGIDIYIDGEWVANLEFGHSFWKALAPGPHTIKVSNTVYSKSDAFELHHGEVQHYSAGNIVSGLTGFMVFSFGVGPYRVYLERADAPNILEQG